MNDEQHSALDDYHDPSTCQKTRCPACDEYYRQLKKLCQLQERHDPLRHDRRDKRLGR